MIRALLVRGLLAGLCAGVLAALFAFAVGEPQIGRAIAFEQSMSPAAGSHEAELVSRDLQSTGGLLVGALVYGIAVGGLFALMFAALYGRVVRTTPARTALALAALAFVTVALVPFLKYPANPPGVGREETIVSRTVLYYALIAVSILAVVVAGRVHGRAARRWSSTAAALCAAAVFVAIVTAAALALPGIDEVPRGFPAETLWHFRLASLGTQLVLWTTLGLGFAFAAQRAMSPSPGAAHAGVAQRG